MWRFTPLFTFILTFSHSLKNVLFIAVDDLRPEHGVFGGDALTPNIDAFAKTALAFSNNNVQIGVCSPSRTSLLTSRYPDYTHVTDLYTYFRSAGCNVTTLPQAFRLSGYKTLGSSKIFHPGHASGSGVDWTGRNPCGAGCNGFNDPPSWNAYQEPPSNSRSPWNVTDGPSWLALDEAQYPVSLHPDSQSAAYIAAALGATSGSSAPFFFAAGFLKPHLPFIFPASFLEPYKSYSTLAPDRAAAVNQSEESWTGWGEIAAYSDIYPIAKGLNLSVPGAQMPQAKALELRRGYLAATSYNDWCVGQVLAALDASGHANDTVVVLWGDHGWQLGDHSDWTKHTNFESVVRAPLLIRSPDHAATSAGKAVRALTQHLDIGPTLLELAGLPPVPTFQGESLVPLLLDPTLPALPARPYAYAQYPRKTTPCSPPELYCDIPHAMGYTVRTPEWRYTEWVAYNNITYTPRWDVPFPGNYASRVWRELWAHKGDTGANWQAFEHENVAELPENAAVVQELSALLHAGPNIVRQ
jgi:iduronate 2-sulfatase